MYLQNRNTFRDTENRPVAAWGDRRWWREGLGVWD